MESNLIEILLQKLLIRLTSLVSDKWTGQVLIEINMSQGAPGNIYFTAKEKMPVEKKCRKNQSNLTGSQKSS